MDISKLKNENGHRPSPSSPPLGDPPGCGTGVQRPYPLSDGGVKRYGTPSSENDTQKHTAKRCPLLSINSDKLVACIESRCAWFNSAAGECNLKTI